MVRRIRPWVLLAAALLTGGAAAAAPAHPAGDANPALRELEADEASRERDLAADEAAAEAARSEVDQLQAQLAALNDAEASGERGVSQKRLALAALNAQQRDLDSELGGEQARLAKLLSALELFRRNPPPALFVRPTDVRDAVRAAILIRAITPELEARAQALKAKAQALQLLRRKVDTTSGDLLVSESNVAEDRSRIEALIAQKTQAQARADAEANAARDDITALADRARALRDLAAGVTAAPTASSALPPDPEHAGLFGHAENFTAPVPGAPIRRFGDPEPGGRTRSDGWTWSAPAGASVLAPAQSLVEYAGPLKGWGLVLILRLGGGYDLVLAGLETTLTAPGRTVTAGQPVGRMGGDGQAASELYFEIRKNGAPVDPARWLKASPGGER